MRGEKKKNETQRGELDLCFGFFFFVSALSQRSFQILLFDSTVFVSVFSSLSLALSFRKNHKGCGVLCRLV